MIEKRQELLGKMIARLIEWDKTDESVAEWMRKNQSDFQLLQQYDSQSQAAYSNKEKKLANQLIEHQKKVVDSIRQERAGLARQMKQMNQKDNVVQHYYQKMDQSLFIDKGL
ncbi:MAG: hypothetical protein L0K82_03285 [Pisciglobus halotolerans]|nr:hypothetical protein [Pisciglobus halotolerans]